MTTYNFTLFFEGPELDEHLDALFDAGFDDALFGRRGSEQFAEFDRRAPSFGDAVLQALRTLEASVPGLLVLRVEPDDLVSQSVIAERTGRSRQSIGLLVTGRRGGGDFPAPVGSIGRASVWQWSEVADWVAAHEGHPPALGGAPQFTRALNGVLEVRSQVKRMSAITAERETEPTLARLAFTAEAVEGLRTLVEESAEAVERELAAV